MSLVRALPSVLIAEDEAIVALDLRRQLEHYGFQVVAVVGRSEEVVAAVQAHKPTVVLMDVRLRGEVDGVTLAEELFVCEDTPVVFLSAYSDCDIVARAARSGAYGYLTKPVTITALISTLQMAIAKHADLRCRRSDADWLGRAIDAVEFAVIGLEADGSVRFMNRAAAAITGRSLLGVRAATPAWAQTLAALPARLARDDVTLNVGGTCPVAVRAQTFPLPGGGLVCLLWLK